jgi:hypothetical protein
LIRSDHGAAVANTVARLAVVAPVRPGGQAQFIDAPVASTESTTLERTRAWALNKLADKLTLADLANHANVSIRTLNRRLPGFSQRDGKPVVSDGYPSSPRNFSERQRQRHEVPRRGPAGLYGTSDASADPPERHATCGRP